TNSLPEIEKNGTPASPAIAFASSVLPLPGGPTRRTPRGIFAPSAWNFLGWRRNSMISSSSSFASSTAAASSKVTRVFASVCSLGRLFPKDIAWLDPDCACRSISIHRPTSTRKGSIVERRLGHSDERDGGSTLILTPLSLSSWMYELSPLGTYVRNGRPSFFEPVTASSPIFTCSICPCCASDTKAL